MTINIVVRKASIDDTARIAELCDALGYPVRAEEVLPRLAAVLDEPHQAVFVAAQPDAGVIGWVHVLVVRYLEAAPFAEIGGIVVDHGFRRVGAGRELMSAAEEWARQQAVSSVRLRSNIIRTEAHAFYLHLGYTIEKSQYTFRKPLA